MKTRLSAITCLSVFLIACAASTETLRDVDPFLQETKVEGCEHASLLELLADPDSMTMDLLKYAGCAEDAVQRSNDDKASARRILGVTP